MTERQGNRPAVSAERWREIGAVVDAALELPPERRAGFVRDTCHDDDLRTDVERLLHACDESAGFLDRSVGEYAAPLLDSHRARDEEEMLSRLRAELSGRFEIARPLAHGGMAVVYLARETKHSRRVALKVLCSELAAAFGAGRFLQEIDILAQLTHPHIVPLIESGEVHGRPYFVMPYIEGESLRARLERDSQLAVSDAIRITHQIAEALDYAHRHNVVHRDLKPENILLADGHAVVGDFGIARAILRAAAAEHGDAADQVLTATGFTLGTPAYMSPEQVLGDPTIDGRSDIYALGCMLYEMLAGRPPFTGPTTESIVRQHLQTRPTDLAILRDEVSPGLVRTVNRAIAKARMDRFATMAEFAESVSRAADSRSPWRTREGLRAWVRSLLPLDHQ